MSLEPRAPASASGIASATLRPDTPLRWIHFYCDPLPCAEAEAPLLLGCKGTSLWLLNRAGLAVPPSFTVTTEACRYYHQHQRQWPDGLWDEVLFGIRRLEGLTGQTFGRGPVPMTLAVRSGAAQSMPGMLATLLDVGLTVSSDRETAADPDLQLRDAITAVFDSWETPAARRFREASDWDQASGTAVTIQTMFPSAVAGVAFSMNPEQPSRAEFVVEAVVGSGRSLVGGQSTPARWFVDRNTRSIRDCSMPATFGSNVSIAAFREHGLLPLCEALPRIEAALQGPVDVEFGFAESRLVFFQARSVVQSASVRNREHIRQQEIASLREWAKQGRTLWIRHNLSETLPSPTPLTWCLWRDFMCGRGGFGTLYRRLGYRPSTLANHDGCLELIAGRIYVDPLRLTDMLGSGYLFTFDPQTLRDDPQAINRPPTRFDLEHLDPWFLWKWPFLLFNMIRSNQRQRRLAKRAAVEFDTEVMPRLRDHVEQERRINLATLTIPQLAAAFERRRALAFDELAPQTLLPGTLGAAAWGALEQQLRPILGDTECRDVMNRWLRQIANPVAVREREMLIGISQGTESLAAFLHEFGHRGPNEMDLSAPRWRECPETLIAAASAMAAVHSHIAETTDAPPAAHLRTTLESHGAGCLHRELLPLLKQALTLLPYREIGKHEWLRTYELLRNVITELSQRWGLTDELHFQSAAEFKLMVADYRFDIMIPPRRDTHRTCQQLHVPHFIDASGDLADFGRPPIVSGSGRVFPATALASGRAVGRVRLLDGNQDLSELGLDAVIVASTIEPGSLPFLVNAVALVVEQGGLLSHVALLARQFSIPSVMCPEITSHIRNGEAIQVDADRGVLELLDRTT